MYLTKVREAKKETVPSMRKNTWQTPVGQRRVTHAHLATFLVPRGDYT